MRNLLTIFGRKKPLEYNPISDTDSYKLSHWNQYPPRITRMMSYLEARGGEYDSCTLFGLQYLIHKYVATKWTRKHVKKLEAFAKLHGEPFNYDGCMKIVKKYKGHPPIRIRAIPEGLVCPVLTPLLTIESTVDDEDVFWVCSFLETMLVRLWYPSTIATTSRESKKILAHYLEMSSDDPSEIVFKLHDFGARGVATYEQAQLGGAAHLLSFMGSDTISGIELANYYYDIEMAGFSIPATEHSTMSMWGREHELDAYKHYVKKYLTERQVPPGIPKLAACVSDTFNVYEACKMWTSPELFPAIEASGGTLVIRPDSGDPLEVLPKIFAILEEQLGDRVTENKKGYKLLPPCIRIIQGDGITQKSMKKILELLVGKLKWSASNIAFGSGGGLLQMVNRDTQKWAFKCCFALRDGVSINVQKDPITDPGKKSKAGRVDTVRLPDGTIGWAVIDDYHTIALPNSVMVTYYEDGFILYHTTYDECRARMAL